MISRRALALATLLALALPGCVAPDLLKTASVEGAAAAFPFDAAFATDGKWSRTLAAGSLQILAPEVVDVPSFDGTKINIGIFRPDVPNGTRVPVIMDAGPYYDDGDAKVGSNDTHRLGGFLIENFVPHGYAVVQASVRGTGQSTGCNDYFGDKEQADLDALVTWLGEQEWSNGNVGMIGRSYDGSTTWEAAAQGNAHLKTIVPISGINDFRLLHYRNGTSETRAPILGALYYSYGATQGGTGSDPNDPTTIPESDPRAVSRMACTEGPQHAPMGALGYLTGGGSTGQPTPLDKYWETRVFTERVLADYRGSLFYVHGLQDWNVRPAQGVDIYNAFDGPKKAMLGQWAHNYPDRPDEHGDLRWDWAEVLLRWFDRELKGIPSDVGPSMEVEDDHGHWQTLARNEWPPQDATWVALHPTVGGKLVDEKSEGSAKLFAPAAPAPDTPVGARVLSWESPVYAEGVVINGQPRFHVTAEPQTPGGILHAELYEKLANSSLLLVGRAQMDLRFAAGGREMHNVQPGAPIVANMEFYPLSARVLPGSALVLALTQENGADLPSPADGPITVLMGDDVTTLELPTTHLPFVASRWDVADEKVLHEYAK